MTDLAEDLNGVLRIDIEEDDPSGRVLTCEMYTSKINYQHVHVLSTKNKVVRSTPGYLKSTPFLYKCGTRLYRRSQRQLHCSLPIDLLLCY